MGSLVYTGNWSRRAKTEIPVQPEETMKFWILVSAFASAAALALVQPAWSQNTPPPVHRIPGYFDPRTGTFRPVAPRSSEETEAAPAIAPTAGKFVLNATITILSSIPTSETIYCEFGVTAFGDSGADFIDSSASAPATRSGSTAKCTVALPYSWPLLTPETDMIDLTFVISTCAACGQPTRFYDQGLPSIKVPPNGTTTTRSVTATL